MNIKDALRKNLYWILPSIFGIIYTIGFYWLERRDTVYHLIYSPLDDSIPFVEYFIIPYFLWFFYIIYAQGEFFLKSKADFIKLNLFLSFGMGIFLILSTLYPTMVDLRPNLSVHKNIFVTLVDFLYQIDTPTNVFPSIHVYNSMAVCITQIYSPLYKHKPIGKIISTCIMVSIILATMFLKQHSILDVIFAIFLGGIAWVLLYSPYKIVLGFTNLSPSKYQ